MGMPFEWFKRLFQAFAPKPQTNAWDDYKRARAMEIASEKPRSKHDSVHWRR